MGEPVDEAAAWRPSSALRPFVAGYVGWRQDGAAPRVHRGLPSRHLTLVLGLEGPVEVIGPAGERHRYGALVGGLHDAPVGIPQPRRHEGIQVSVTPAGARALLGVPAAAVASAIVDLGDLLGPWADELLERLAAAGGWSARFRLLDGVLAELIGRGAGRGAEVPAEVGEAWRRLVATGGGVAVGDLAHDLGWSRRHLGERFRREVGLAPKVAARVLRFEAACREIRRPDRPSLADVAATCGYADQSHLVREWHAFAGCAPTTWMAEELPIRPRRGGAGGRRLTSMDTSPAPTVWPALSYDDAPAAIRFLEALGFVADLVVPGDGDRAVAHAELRWPAGGGVMLGSAAGSTSAAAPGTAAVYVVTDEPDALFERATAAGAEVVAGLADEEYGSRGFTIRDPEGGQWTFGTYRGAAAG